MKTINIIILAGILILVGLYGAYILTGNESFERAMHINFIFNPTIESIFTLLVIIVVGALIVKFHKDKNNESPKKQSKQ